MEHEHDNHRHLPQHVRIPPHSQSAVGDGVSREWWAAQLDPVALDARIEPVNLGQSWDRQQRQQAVLAHAEVALRVLAPAQAQHARRDPAQMPGGHTPATAAMEAPCR